MRHVYHAGTPTPAAIPGIDHATWAGAAEGLSGLSLWRQTLAAGAATPPHSHDCDEVVICLEGAGEVLVAGRAEPFAAGSIVVLPRGVPHQIRSTGAAPLGLVAAFGATPVPTSLADGAALELPWRS